jgi:hypothetical protein
MSEPEDGGTLDQTALITWHQGRHDDAPEYKTVNGAFGGPDPYGEVVVAHFFLEHHSIPIASTLKINAEDPSGPLSEQVDKRSEGRRDIQAMLTMSPEAAVRIGQWLEAHGKRILDSRQKGED